MAHVTTRPRSPRVPDIRKGDQVLVLTGREAGKRGTVDRVVRNSQSFKKSTAKYGSAWRKVSPLAGVAVVVEGLNIAKRHTKPRPKQGRTDRQPRIQQGGIIEVSQPILASKVMVVCPHCSEPTRIKHGTTADGHSSPGLVLKCGETLSGEGSRRKEVNEDGLRRRWDLDEVVPALTKEFGYANPDAGSAAVQDRGQHRHGRGNRQRQGHGRRGVGSAPDHRPAAGRHEVTPGDLELQAAHRHADRAQGHAAW